MPVKFTDLPDSIIDKIDPNHNLRHVSNALNRDKLRDLPCMNSAREELNRMKKESSNPCGNSTVEYKKGMNLQRPIICAINSKDRMLHIKVSDQDFDFLKISGIVQCFDHHYVLRVTIIPTTEFEDVGGNLSRLKKSIKINNTLICRGGFSIAPLAFQHTADLSAMGSLSSNKRSDIHDDDDDDDLYS